MASIATMRLAEERKKWRKDHPFAFTAKPTTNDDGSVDLLTWSCNVPGKQGSLWEGGLYPVTLKFPPTYPVHPPVVSFPQDFLHPNVFFPSGQVCLSLLNTEKSWKPSISVKEILLGLQELLVDPNNTDPANWDVAHLYRHNKKAYEREVKALAIKYKAPDDA